jgi:hypothetical protein
MAVPLRLYKKFWTRKLLMICRKILNFALTSVHRGEREKGKRFARAGKWFSPPLCREKAARASARQYNFSNCKWRPMQTESFFRSPAPSTFSHRHFPKRKGNPVLTHPVQKTHRRQRGHAPMERGPVNKTRRERRPAGRHTHVQTKKLISAAP